MGRMGGDRPHGTVCRRRRRILPDDVYAFEATLRQLLPHRLCRDPGPPWLTAFAQRSPFAELSGAGQFNGDKAIACRAGRATTGGGAHLRRLISEQVGLILRRAIDPDRPLSEYGLDSLGNLELRTRLEAETGVRITAMGLSTVRALAESLCDTLAAEGAVGAVS